MNTIRAYIEAAKAAATVQSEPKPIPPRPQSRVHTMPGPIASVALRVVQQLILTLIRKDILTIDEADVIFNHADKATGGLQQCGYLTAEAKDQIGWDLAYGEPQPNDKPIKPGNKAA